DDAVVVLDDGPRRRTGLQAARVFAVHAAVLADQPFEVAGGVLVFGEPHDRPGLIGHVGGVVVHPDVAADFVAQVVPFHAGHLTGLAAYAFGGVDQFGDAAADDLATRPGGRRGGGGASFDIQGLKCHGFLRSYAFSTLTRKDLDSGVYELPSPTGGVRVLARKPGFASPTKPQCSGMPTWCTVLPSTVRALMRLVTTATALM